ncbi:MAG: PAS domain S-box protein [Luteimonas sp.]|nr:PAS domain S-box protein [Luteimonas sp.]
MSEQAGFPVESPETNVSVSLPVDDGRQFQMLVQGVTDYAIYLLDPTGHIVSWNPGGERIKGYAANEVLGGHFSMFYTEEDAANGEPARALQTAVREGKYEKEGWRLRKDGTRFWASVVIDPIQEHGRLIGFAKVTRDISERRVAQEALAEAQRALMQSQKAEAISQLTYGLAHDFNNLLTVITNSLDRIAACGGDAQKIAQSVTIAQRASDRGALLTRQLLAFSRGELIRSTAQNINELIQGSESLFRRACDAPVAIRFDLDSHLPNVAIDRSQFEAAVLNLVINARDALPQGGDIVVTTRLLSAKSGEERVSLTVEDNGTGMTEEVIAKAFDPFFTTKEVGKGSGLGLSQVYGVVTQSGGTVSIKSTPGEGTAVTMTLPVLEDGEQRVAAPRPTKILMVDDDSNILDTVVDALRDLDYSMVTAMNGKEALERLANDAGIDILFSDVVMPGGLSGIELARQAHALRPDLKILLASGYSESWLEDMPGYCEFIPKPYRLNDLKPKLTRE